MDEGYLVTSLNRHQILSSLSGLDSHRDTGVMCLYIRSSVRLKGPSVSIRLELRSLSSW